MGYIPLCSNSAGLPYVRVAVKPKIKSSYILSLHTIEDKAIYLMANNDTVITYEEVSKKVSLSFSAGVQPKGNIHNLLRVFDLLF